MSNSLAIAGVTAVLRDMIINRLALDPVASSIGTVNVSVGSPDRIDLNSTEPNQVNLFLHQVTPNIGYANLGLPSRDANGRRIDSQALVLDLHYLVSVYGAQPFYPEILFGEIAQELHEQAVPSRQIISRALNPAVPPSNFPAGLNNCGLDRQIERIKITPETVSNEELSKLWSALQANYRLTAAYQVTTVIIESDEQGTSALPVGRAISQAESIAIPNITDIYLASDKNDSIVMGSTIRVEGNDLASVDSRVFVGETDLTSSLTTIKPGCLEITLPTVGAGLRAGPTSLRIVHRKSISQPPEIRNAISSNTGIFMLRPQVTASISNDSTEIRDSISYRSGQFDLTINPPVLPIQKVKIFLNQVAAPYNSYAFNAEDGNDIAPPATESASVSIPFQQIAAGTYLLRVQVNMAESPLSKDIATGIYNGPSIIL